MDKTIKLCGVALKNPIILASGIVDTTASSLVRAIKNGAGAVTCKSISLEPRYGHTAPIIQTHKTGMINAVGLPNPGMKTSVNEIKDYKKRCDAPVLGNIVAWSAKDFGKACKQINESNCDLLELNLSCPNVEDEFGKPFATDVDMAVSVVKESKKNTDIPIFVKLAPNVPNIVEIAKAVENAGADGITAINTMPSMVIDINTSRPVITNKVGGYSGPGLKPIAIKCVYDLYAAVKIPIIGTGGVTCGEDAIEMLMAGASAVGVGTAVYYRGIEVFSKINEEIDKFMRDKGHRNIKEIVGMSHEN